MHNLDASAETLTYRQTSSAQSSKVHSSRSQRQFQFQCPFQKRSELTCCCETVCCNQEKCHRIHFLSLWKLQVWKEKHSTGNRPLLCTMSVKCSPFFVLMSKENFKKLVSRWRQTSVIKTICRERFFCVLLLKHWSQPRLGDQVKKKFVESVSFPQLFQNFQCNSDYKEWKPSSWRTFWNPCTVQSLEEPGPKIWALHKLCHLWNQLVWHTTR